MALKLFCVCVCVCTYVTKTDTGTVWTDIRQNSAVVILVGEIIVLV